MKKNGNYTCVLCERSYKEAKLMVALKDDNSLHICDSCIDALMDTKREFLRNHIRENQPVDDSVEQLFLCNDEYDYMDELAKETGKKEVINDRKTDEEEFYGKTELVYSASNAEKILKARTKKYKDIELTRFPFVIGKIPDMVDEIIDHKTISRIHARFILSEDGNTVFTK